jgi:hypothetical protein
MAVQTTDPLIAAAMSMPSRRLTVQDLPITIYTLRAGNGGTQNNASMLSPVHLSV